MTQCLSVFWTTVSLDFCGQWIITNGSVIVHIAIFIRQGSFIETCTFLTLSATYIQNTSFDVFSTVHHSIELFHLPTLMHNSLFINKRMLHYYPRHVSSINMPTFRRTNCIHTASGTVALCKRLHSTPVESGLLVLLVLHYVIWCFFDRAS